MKDEIMNGKLDDEMLDRVAGGMGVSDDPQSAGRCPHCSAYLKKTPYGYVCRDCGAMYDRNRRPLAGK